MGFKLALQTRLSGVSTLIDSLSMRLKGYLAERYGVSHPYLKNLTMFYFQCPKCFKWSKTPKGFDERVHCVKCDCTKIMLLTHGKPEDDAMRKQDEIKGYERGFNSGYAFCLNKVKDVVQPITE